MKLVSLRYCEYCLKEGKVWYSINSPIDINSSPSFTWLTGIVTPYTFLWTASYDQVLNQIIANFGQWWQTGLTYYPSAWGSFKYEPPTGFKALSTKNLPEPSIVDPSEHFDILTWTGNWANQNISGLDFQPDLAWTKLRSHVDHHILMDTVRDEGTTLTKNLRSNTTIAEYVWWHSMTVNPTGFSVSGHSWGEFNYNNYNYVTWNWKAGWIAVTNTDWSITSQVSANVDAGFSIVGYTGNWVNGQTIGHWLNKAPELILLKNRNRSTWTNWNVYNKTIWADYWLRLNTSDVPISDWTYHNRWWDWTKGVYPTDTVFTIWLDGYVNFAWTEHIAYAFHSVPWYSKVWSYTGNGSADGPFVHTGFKPRYVMIKRTDWNFSWNILDTWRDSTNPNSSILQADLTNTEVTHADLLDFTSNWFKFRLASQAANYSWWKYIYIAFAEAPFKYANAR